MAQETMGVQIKREREDSIDDDQIPNNQNLSQRKKKAKKSHRKAMNGGDGTGNEVKNKEVNGKKKKKNKGKNQEARQETPIKPPVSPFKKKAEMEMAKPAPVLRPLMAAAPVASPTQGLAIALKRTDDWEYKTGYIRASVGAENEDARREENVAWSSTYIRSPMRDTAGVSISKGIKFKTYYLAMNQEILFSENNEGVGMRVCSVGKGSVWVTLGKEKFRIAEGGLFRVAEEEKCVVKNYDRVEGVLHVTSVLRAGAAGGMVV